MRADQLPSLYPPAFGRVISARRIQAGLSQEALAERAAFHRTYIGDIERGQRNVALMNIVRLAVALQTTPEQLMHETSLEVAKVSSQTTSQQCSED